MTPAGFPHSGIHGSQPAFGSPWLFVDRYALHRLPVPRHPPCALSSLTIVLSIPFVMLESLLGSHCTHREIVKPVSTASCNFSITTSVASLSFDSSLFSSQGTRQQGPAGPIRAPHSSFNEMRRAGRQSAGFGIVTFASASVLSGGGLKWTRTIDLTLIRRAL